MFEPGYVEDALYTVVARRPVTPVIVELRLKPCAEAMRFRAGQFVELCDPAHALPLRSYSVANAPRADGQITLLVTRVAHGATSLWLHDKLRPGDEVSLSGPYGTFLVDTGAARPLLLLSAGSGLAPARALAEAALEARPDRRLSLFFSARTAADAIDRQTYEAWQQLFPGYRYLLTLTRDTAAPLQGRIPSLLPTLFRQLADHEVFISGPPAFVAACVDAALRLGAPRARVHAEAFFREPQPWSERTGTEEEEYRHG